jgi:hypothetical protein
MRLRSLHLAAIAVVVSVFAIGSSAARAQGVAISISPTDSAAAAEAIAAGNYGAELTPPQGEVSKGSAAFMRVGQGAIQAMPADVIDPLVTIPLPSWGPVDLGYFNSLPTTAHTLTSTRQWNVYLGCPASDQTCWGNPQQFIADLNASKFIHVADQYVGSNALKRYPLASSYFYNLPASPPVSPVNGTSTIAWLLSVVGAAAALPGNTPASVTGPGNLYHLFFNQGIDVCIDDGDTTCYSPNNLSTFAFCGYHEYVDFNAPYGRVYFTVEPYQAVNGCFGPTSDITSATANVLSHEIFESITDPNLDAWFGTGNPIDNLGEEIGDQCVWLHLYPQKLNLLHQAYVTQNEYSNKYHSCVDKP